MRWFGVLCLPLVAATALSLYSAFTAPGNLSLNERAVEWLRDHHFGDQVSGVEHWYYARHQPAVGAALTGTLPFSSTLPHGSSRPSPTADPPTTAAGIEPFVASTVPGEGQWRPVGALVDGVPAIQVAYLRPDATHTGVLAAVARIDQRVARFRLVAGRTVPGHGPWSGGNAVPAAQLPRLLAAFNSGFRIQDANGGFYADGRSVGGLQDGAASLVVHRDGTATVDQWGRDARLSSDVVAVRQNLSLVVDGGRTVDGLDDNTDNRWGKTIGNALLVWRSGVGVDADGNLLYAASDGLSVRTLADLLVRAGAVRAMELDINHPWVSFNIFTGQPAGQGADQAVALSGTKLLPGMAKPATRYLGPDDRDFVAVLATDPPGAAAAP